MEKPLVTATGQDYALESEPLGRRIEVSDPKVTGVIDGGLLAYASTTTFTYTAGNGVLHDVQDASKSAPVSWPAPASPITRTPATPNALLVITLTFPGPTVVQREIQNFTPSVFRTELVLGTIELDNTGAIATPDAIVPQVIPANGFPFSFLDFLSASAYSVIESGFILEPNGANVQLDLSEGVLFSPGANFHNSKINPNLITLPEWKPLKFNSILANGSVIGTQIQNVDTAQYDAGIGSLGALPAGRWIGHVFYQDITGTVFMQYGQIHFPSLAALLSSFVDVMALFIYANQFNKYATSIGAVLFVSGATDFSNPAQAIILDRTYFGPNGRLWRDARSVNTVSQTPPDDTGNVPLTTLQNEADPTKFLLFDLAPWATSTALTVDLPYNGPDGYVLLNRNAGDFAYLDKRRLGIFTNNPEAVFHTKMELGSDFEVRCDRYTGAAQRPEGAINFNLYKARGSAAVPAAVLTGDGVSALTALAHDGTTFKITASMQNDVELISGTTISGSTTFQTADSGGDLQDAIHMTAAQNVGIRTRTPEAILHTKDDSGFSVRFDRYTGGAGNPGGGINLYLAKARGSSSAPAVVVPTDSIGSVVMSAYDGTTFGTHGVIKADVVTVAGSTISTSMTFQTASTAGALQNSFFLDNAGNVAVEQGKMLGLNGPGTQDGLVKNATTGNIELFKNGAVVATW